MTYFLIGDPHLLKEKKTAQVMIERIWNISFIPSLGYSVTGI
ncbi:MAG: hypothetical protein WAL98_11265 [Desulfatiglandaceae bacterium]